MNALKPLVIFAVLAGIGYGVYTRINSGPTTPPPGAETTWSQPSVQLGSSGPSVAMGDAASPVMPQAAPGTAPAFTSASAEAPRYAPAANTLTTNIGAPPNMGVVAQTNIGESAAPNMTAAGAANSSGGVTGVAAYDPRGLSTPPSAEIATNAAGVELAGQFEQALRQARGELDAGAPLADVLKNLTPWYDRPGLTSAESQELNDLLGQLAGSVLYSNEEHLGPLHEAQAGETLETIAEKYRVSPQLLAKVNGLVDGAVRPGMRLKVTPGPFNAVVNLEKRELILLVDGMYAGRFGLGFGADVPIREGQFRVIEKVRQPVFHGGQRTVPGEDPSNPYGGYLISLDDNLKLHGRMQTSADGNDQPGCMNLAMPDIDDVFDILTVGSRVTVHR